MKLPLARAATLLALGTAAVLGLAACGGTSSSGGAVAGSSTPAAAASVDASAMAAAHQETFCANAKSLGSLTKGNADAMAMAPADSAKDFQALADKVAALKPDAPTALQPDIELISANLGLEVMVMSLKADGTSADQEMAQMEGQKATSDAAVAKLISEVRTSCGTDIT